MTKQSEVSQRTKITEALNAIRAKKGDIPVYENIEENIDETITELENSIAEIDKAMSKESKVSDKRTKVSKPTKEQEMKEHLSKVANFCDIHQVNYVKGLSECPLCYSDRTATKRYLFKRKIVKKRYKDRLRG